MEAPIKLDPATHELPPLILHPFNERVTPSDLLENSKASLMLCGLMPDNGADPEELRRRVLAGRYSEIRMLFFLGRDVLRWVEQCLESSERKADQSVSLQPQSFIRLLAENPPLDVREKLLRWGVADYSSIFTRAVGLNALFREPPAFGSLSEEFLRNYHCYADSVYRSYVEMQPHSIIRPNQFHFELYASGEYSRKLESEWGEST
jgi:hypothetical protein